MHSFLRTNPFLSSILLFSPAVLAIPLFILGGDYLTVLYSTIFLGSFHIILTPLFQSLLAQHNPEITALNRKINFISLYIFLIGLSLAFFSNVHLTTLSEEIRILIYSLVIFSVGFHSAQQEFGILLALQKISHFSFIKFSYRIIPFVITVNYYLHARGIDQYQMGLFFSLLTLTIAILYFISKKANTISFIFALRILLWPTSIYIPQLTPLVFAMHGIEYLVFYFYLRSKLNTKMPSQFSISVNFALTMILTMTTYGLGHFLKYLSITSLSEYLLCAHFALQFRHYWLDRQIFRLSKPIGKLSGINIVNSKEF